MCLPIYTFLLIDVLDDLFLTEFPPVAAFVTHDEGCHRFVSRSCLELVVGTVAFLALSALQQVGLGALGDGKLRGIDSLFDEILSLLLDLG